MKERSWTRWLGFLNEERCMTRTRGIRMLASRSEGMRVVMDGRSQPLQPLPGLALRSALSSCSDERSRPQSSPGRHAGEQRPRSRPRTLSCLPDSRSHSRCIDPAPNPATPPHLRCPDSTASSPHHQPPTSLTCVWMKRARHYTRATQKPWPHITPDPAGNPCPPAPSKPPA